MLFLPLKKPQPQPEAGFTLLEVLVVIVIIGILAAIAAPSWLAYATRQRLNAVESDLTEVLRQAQQRAVSQRRTVTVEIDEAATIPTVNVDGIAQTLGPNELRPGMVELEVDAPDGAVEIAFDYQGTTSGQEASLPFVVNILPSTGTQQQCAIVATLLGNIKTASSADECTNPSL